MTNETDPGKSRTFLPAAQRRITLPPWVLFGVFLASNALLSYGSFSIYLQFWIALLGLGVPFLLACRETSVEQPGSQAFPGECLPPSWLAWGPLFLGLALFLRFWKLTALSVWPLDDEAVFSYWAQRILEGEPLRWFYTHKIVPPIPFMGLAFFYKAFGVSFRTLWLYPAVLTSVSLFFYGWAARRLFSRSFAFLFLLGLGLGFWPLLIGRQVNWGCLLYLWEGISLFAFALFFTKSPGRSRLPEAAGLGLAVGTGFYTHLSWAVAALGLGLAMASACLSQRRRDWVSLAAFLATALLVFSPLAWNLWRRMDPSFLSRLWAFNGRPPGPIVLDLVTNLSSFFWGRAPTAVYFYNPLWGGFFNPVLGALIFLGLVELWRLRSASWARIFLISSFALWLPQALSRGEEYTRSVLLIPVFLFLAAAGARRLFIRPPAKPFLAGVLALALLGLSLGFDGYHLFGVYHQWWIPAPGQGLNGKSLERQRAFQWFDLARRQWGPGLILTNLVDDNHDQTLGLATWEFNAAENPNLPAPRVPWVGILCNVHYRGYLTRHFPGARCYWLSGDVFRENGGWMAGILPVEPSGLSTLQRWVKAEKAMYILAGDLMGSGLSDESTALPARLEGLYPLFKGDPFLESCYGEKLARFAFWNKRYADMAGPLQDAIRRGIPAAHLYARLGESYLLAGDFEKAGRALNQAMNSPDNLTNAAFLYTHYVEPRRVLSFQ